MKNIQQSDKNILHIDIITIALIVSTIIIAFLLSYSPISYQYRTGEIAQVNIVSPANIIYFNNEKYMRIFNKKRDKIIKEVLPVFRKYKVNLQNVGIVVKGKQAKKLNTLVNNLYMININDFEKIKQHKAIEVRIGNKSIKVSRYKLIVIGRANNLSFVEQMLKYTDIDMFSILQIAEAIYPNLVYDISTFKERVKEAVDSLDRNSIKAKCYSSLKEGALIIHKGKKLDENDILMLNAVNDYYFGKYIRFLFTVIILVLLGSLIFIKYFAYYYYNEFYNRKMRSLIIVLLLIGISATVIIKNIIKLRNAPISFFIPTAFIPLTISFFVGRRFAIIFSFFVIFLSSTLLLYNDNMLNIYNIIFPTFYSIAGIMPVYNINKRTDIYKSTLLMGAVGSFISISLAILTSRIMYHAFLGVWINAIVTSALTLGILPICENISDMVTVFRLQELLNINHPLLKELSQKAPGTYQHSTAVANISEAAAEAVGANALLAKVGAYYHDIGKMDIPEYFIENQTPGMENMHDNLKPSLSASIIKTHVKKGIELAKQYKLPSRITDFIKEHHGTSLIQYFYYKAVEKLGEDNVTREEFCYPGPKPSSKESAIVMLADSIEAASRSLETPTPTKIENLVNEIIRNRFLEGELDNADITLKDLKIIAKVFVKTITGMLHTRISYPKEEDSE